MPIPQEFIAIDEEGFPLSGELRIQDAEIGAHFFNQLKVHPSGSLVSYFGETPVLVEAFDEPFVAQQIYLKQDQWCLLLPYGVEKVFSLDSLTVDEWDRFHGYTSENIPFVMSRKAQALFFEALDEFDDESITFRDKTYPIPAYWAVDKQVEKADSWCERYKNNNTGWDLGKPAPALVDMLPRLKLSRSRVLVLGCGSGHDAAHFAKDGHIVTAVDFSAEALKKAQAQYSEFNNINWIQADVFNLPQAWDGAFDVVFEHTCYCAVNPTKRAQLAKIWKRVLAPGGHLMGVFFTFEKRQGPPYGGTEWEIRQRLKKDFHFIFWGRWKNSVENRQGKELFVYGSKM
ncbi:MAG: methyltransferase domain-containing protein [Bdellovibrionia bacterium]